MARSTAVSQLVVLNAERLATEELCPRRRFWTEKYAQLRVSPLRALYMALDAGHAQHMTLRRQQRANCSPWRVLLDWTSLAGMSTRLRCTIRSSQAYSPWL